MPNRPRRILPGRLYEITRTTIGSRYFFIPGERLNKIIIGAYARAAELYGVQVCYMTWMSNHAHILFRARSAAQYKDTLRVAHFKIAIEVKNLCREYGKKWDGGIFEGKPKVAEVGPGRGNELKRLKYLMSQGVKEGLVPHPTLWPGVNSAAAWLSGSMKLEGVWLDRSSEYEIDRGEKRRRLKTVSKELMEHRRGECTRPLELPLAPLPCMDEMSAEERASIVQQLCDEILEENATKIAKVRKGWRRRLCNPRKFTFRPKQQRKKKEKKNDVVPEVYAESKEAYWIWKAEWRVWLATYFRASRRLARGIAAALDEFPEGCFVPSGVFATDVGRSPPL